MDPRTKKLAKLVAEYSLKIKPKENVIISGNTEAKELIVELYKKITLLGANPILRVNLPGLTPFFDKYAKDYQLKRFPKALNYTVKNSQKYIRIFTDTDRKELASVDHKKIIARQKVTSPITNYIANERDKIWRCSVGFPSKILAREAGMSLTQYTNFFYSACLQDWEKLGKKMDKILKRFKKNSTVHLIGENVDLKFKVHGHKAIADKGEENMPGGEIFMAPVRTSLNGYIKFEYPTVRDGKEVRDIELTFKNGKVIKSKASKNQGFLRAMLATDKNASYVGELGIGLNPKVTKYTKNLLFDEKIGGTIHLALGMAYKKNGGGNDSAIHWDIVKSMKKAKIIVDGKVLQEKGVWKV